MSNEQSIYIGAYLKVELLPYNVEDAEDECPEHGDISHIARNAKFCPTCGEKIIQMFHEKEKFMSYYDMIDDEGMMDTYVQDLPPNQIIVVSNMSGDGSHISLDSSDEGLYDIINQGDAIDTLCEDNKDTIQRLINHEHVLSVSYNYGIVIYWS